MNSKALVFSVIIALNLMLLSMPPSFSQPLHLQADIFKGNEVAAMANRNRLRLVSAAYMLSSGLGATIAIHENLRSEFVGVTSDASVRRGFLLMPGTALSPPLGVMLTHATCNVLAAQPGKLGKIGVAGLVVHGVMFAVGMLGEPITYKVLNPRTFNFPKATIVVSNIVLPVLMVKYGIQTLKGDRHALP